MIKRLAAAQGIDVLNLVKSVQEVQQEKHQNLDQAAQMEAVKNAPQMVQAAGQMAENTPQMAAGTPDEQLPPEV